MRKEYDEHKEMSDILKAELDREAREILAEIDLGKSEKRRARSANRGAPEGAADVKDVLT